MNKDKQVFNEFKTNIFYNPAEHDQDRINDLIKTIQKKDKQIEQLKATLNKSRTHVLKQLNKINKLLYTIIEVKKFHDRLPSEWFSEQIYGLMEDALNE